VLWPLHLRRGLYEHGLAAYRSGADAARRVAEAAGEPRALGRMQVQRAFCAMRLGRFAEAEAALEEAVAGDRAAGHRRGVATALEMLGLVRLQQWRWEAAEDCFTRCRAVWEEIGPAGDGAEDRERGLALCEAEDGGLVVGSEGSGRGEHPGVALHGVPGSRPRERQNSMRHAKSSGLAQGGKQPGAAPSPVPAP
jgi:tetratricopeptide (TPR) repeat protein